MSKERGGRGTKRVKREIEEVGCRKNVKRGYRMWVRREEGVGGRGLRERLIKWRKLGVKRG